MKARLAALALCVACTTTGTPSGRGGIATTDESADAAKAARRQTTDADFAETYDPGPKPLFYMTSHYAAQLYGNGTACAITMLADYQWPVLVLYDDGLLIRSVMTDTRQESKRTYASYHLSESSMKALLDAMPSGGDLAKYDPAYGKPGDSKLLHRYVSWRTGKRQDVRIYPGRAVTGVPPELLATFDRILAEPGGGAKVFIPGRYDVHLVPHDGAKPRKGAKWPEDAPTPPRNGGSILVDAADFDGVEAFLKVNDCGTSVYSRIDNRWYAVRMRAFFRQQHLWLNEAPGVAASFALLRSEQPRDRAEGGLRIDAAVKEDPSLASKLLRHRDGAVRGAGAGAVLRTKTKGVERELSALLGDKNSLARTQAAAALLALKRDKAMKASRVVVRGLKEKDEATKLAALLALPDAAPRLVKPADLAPLLEDASPEVRVKAAGRYLEFAKTPTPNVVTALASALDAPFSETRIGALRVLSDTAKLAGPVVKRIALRLDDGDDQVRHAACDTLGSLRASGVDTAPAAKGLERLARNEETEAAACAYALLVHHASGERLDEILVQILKRDYVPQWAIDAASRTKDPARIARLGPALARRVDDVFTTDALHPLDVLVQFHWKPKTTLVLARRKAKACANKPCSKRSSKIVDAALQLSENK